MFHSRRALHTAAARAGADPTEYADLLNKGLLYCSRCCSWHPAEQFGLDASKATGRRPECRASRRRRR